MLSSYLHFVDELLLDYQQHPGVASGEASAQRRLTTLQQLRTELANAYQTVLARQQQELQWKERGQSPIAP